MKSSDIMIENILSKLDTDRYADLSIEELRVLYEIDESCDKKLSDYIDIRDNYNDFCKMFGRKQVARSFDEINLNTIAYIGNLFIDRRLQTHNLKYVLGSLIGNNRIANLENLEIVYGYLFVSDINEYYSMLSNLRVVKLLCVTLLDDSCIDLSFIEKVESMDLNINNLQNLKYPNKVNSLVINAPNEKNSNLHFPSNLKKLEIKYLENAKGIVFPNSLESLSLNNLECAKGLVLPNNLKDLYLHNLKSTKNLVLNNGLEILELSSIKELDGIVFPNSIKGLDIRNVHNLNDLVLPTSIEKIHINNYELGKKYNLTNIDILIFDKLNEDYKVKKLNI